MDRLLTYQIAFSSLKGINLSAARHLLEMVGDEERFFTISERELHAECGRKMQIFGETYRRELLDHAKAECDYINNNKVNPIYFKSADYPKRLLECDDAPPMLYTCGECNLNMTRVVSIVGTRHATPYGIAFVNDLIDSLSRQIEDILIVSGLAYGIDIAAHRAAIARNVPTAAVFGHGLATVYPAQHRSDAAKMIHNGGIAITEYRHDADIHKGNFLARNRIVAGMCDCLVIVESAAKGGALVTAKTASNYHRDVFALPGRSTDIYSQGCNSLIARNIASLIQTPDDLIDAMGWYRRPAEGEQTSFAFELSPDEITVFQTLQQRGEARNSELSVQLNIPIHRLSAILVEMEFKGLVTCYPGGLYRPAKIHP